MLLTTFFVAALASGASATFNHNPTKIATHNISSTKITDPNDWRYFHTEGIRTYNLKGWIGKKGGYTKINEIKAVHDEVITPSLTNGIALPSPLLPSSDPEILAVYALAIAQFEAEQQKSVKEKAEDLVQRKKDMAKFDEMNICVHDKHYCPDPRVGPMTTIGRDYKNYRKDYEKRKVTLKQQVLVDGLVDLGAMLKVFMDETGEKIEMS